MAKCKCSVCGQDILDKNSAVKVQNRYQHEKCFNSQMKLLVGNKATKLKEKDGQQKKNKSTLQVPKDAISEEEYKVKKAFFDYMANLMGQTQLPAKFLVLSNKYIEQYQSSWSEMYDIFIWYYDIEKHEVEGDCIGLFPYILDEGRLYYKTLKETAEINQEIDINSLYKVQNKHVKLSPITNQELIDITTIV